MFQASPVENEVIKLITDPTKKPKQDGKTTKDMYDFYHDLYDEIVAIRKRCPNFASDAGFTKATDSEAFMTVIKYGLQLEILSPKAVFGESASSANEKRQVALKKIGNNGILEITGEASYQLAETYRDLLEKANEKKYWPNPNVPALLGQSFATAYASQFQDRSIERTGIIAELNKAMQAWRSTHPLDVPAAVASAAP